MKRRYFLGAALSGAACSRKTRSSLRTFTEFEAATLNAWLDCLVPADDTPGALDAGVIHYIDRQLTRRFKKHRADYTLALTHIDRMARDRHGRPFAELSFESRAALLEDMERQELRAFDMVLNHCMQGFYASPRHGGNKDYASWRMLGVSPAPVRGRLHYDGGGEA